MTCFVAISQRSFHTWRMRAFLTLVLLTALVLLAPRAQAFEPEQALRELHVQYQGEQTFHVAQSGMSLSQATEMIRRRTGGQVLSAQTRVEGGREVHYIKVLKDGKVKTHKVNGRRR